MKEFIFDKRYGLVPYEQALCRNIPKETWEELRSVGVRITGVNGCAIRIEPWDPAKRDQYYITDFVSICEWEEPSLYISIPRGTGKNELAKRLLNYQYGLPLTHWCTAEVAKYCQEDAKVTYDLYKRHIIPQEIKDVKFNGPATIVFWGDGTKTIVKTQNGELNDPEKAIAMCIAKHFLGTNKSGSNYYDQIKKWLPKEEKK